MKTNYLKSTVAAICLLLHFSANAHDFESEGFFFDITSETDLTVSLTYDDRFEFAYIGDIIIPENVPHNGKTYRVTGIKYSALSGGYGLSSVTIPASIIHIEDGAFDGCRDLTRLIVTENNPAYTSVDGVLFDKDKNTLILYPAAKEGESYTIPESVTKIGSKAFFDCSKLQNIIIPESIISIGRYAFMGTPFYQNMPDGIVYINNILYCYKGEMPEDTHIEIKEGTTSIGEYAFSYSYYPQLTSVSFPSTLTHIGFRAFFECSNLIEVSFPASLTYIGDEAFSCTKLNSVVIIPAGVTHIGKDAFKYTLLSEYTVDSDNPAYRAIDGVLFNKDASLLIHYPDQKSTASYTIPEGTIEIGSEAFDDCPHLETLMIPVSLTTFGDNAIVHCYDLKEISIPENVNHIGKGTFGSCAGLEAILVHENNSAYSSIDGVLFDKDKKTLILHPYAKALKSGYTYAIPDGTETIAERAFQFCEIKNISFPATLKTIESEAFRDCERLTAVTIPDNVTDIGWYAFYYCPQIKTIVIGEGITSLNTMIFDCKNTTSITIGSHIALIADDAFWNCSPLLTEIVCKNPTPPIFNDSYGKAFEGIDASNCKLYVPTGSGDKYRNAEVWKEFNITEKTFSGIHSAETKEARIYTRSHNIVIENALPGTPLSVYNTAGVCIESMEISDSETEIALPAQGLYIVKYGDRSMKVVL